MSRAAAHAPSDESSTLIHPRWLRITHWLNVCAVVVLVLSGWRIYNASPLFELRFPREWTIGGWLGGVIFDATLSYRAAFQAALGFNLLNLMLLGMLYLIQRRRVLALR